MSHRAAAQSLSGIVDGVALRTGAWVLVDRFSVIVAHGTGTMPCPAPLAQAVLVKSTGRLRGAVVWKRDGDLLHGSVEGTSVVVADLGNGVTAWFAGGPVEPQSLTALAAAAHADELTAGDAVVEELLHPRGPARRGCAPQALLVAFRADCPLVVLSRQVVTAVAGTNARVHVEGELTLVALAADGDAAALAARVRVGCPTAVAGVAIVANHASDWVVAARLADESARAAADLGIALGKASDPAIAAELVVREAQEAVADLVRELPDHALARLAEYDARTCGHLAASLAAWCQAGFNTPAAAASLHVHTNTLRYRLERAAEVSGLDLRRPRQVLALQLLLAV